MLEIVLELLADSRRRRRPHHHRQRAAPPDDRGRDEAHGRRRRSSTPTSRTATTTTTPRTPTAWSSSAAPRTARWCEINRRAAESDLVIYVNINLVPMDGGHKSVGIGPVRLRVAARAPQPARRSASPTATWIRSSSALHRSDRAHRPRHRQAPQGLPHRDRAQQPHVRRARSAFLMKNEDDFTEFDRLKFQAMQVRARRRLPRAAEARDLHARPRAPTSVIGVHAGATEPVHEKTLEPCCEQYSVPVEGQADILIFGIPYISPVQRELQPQPAARAGDGARLLLQPVPRRAAGEEGRRHDRHAPVLRRVRSRAPPAATSSSSTGSCPRRATR